jgi:hypothetical protein
MATTWDPVDREKVAFHEAGHAVVAWLFGLPLVRIYLDLETEGGGAVSEVDLTHLCIVHQIAFHYAGPVSEEIFKGPASSHRCSGDHLNVYVLLEKNGTPEEKTEGQAIQKRAYTLAEKLLRRHEAKVARVAEALLPPPHEIDGAKFEQLMRVG